MGLNEEEEIISLINCGFSLELLNLELSIPMEELKRCKDRLALRRFAKDSIKNGNMQLAIQKLTQYIEFSSENSCIEQVMAMRLSAYADKTNVDESRIQSINLEYKNAGSTQNIDEILEGLHVQIPKRKSSNIKKKDGIEVETKVLLEEKTKAQVSQIDYERLIKKYHKMIESSPQKSQNARNLLAFTYFRAGMIEESRDELMKLIEESNSYMAYRQLIYLETQQGNYEDAKLWAQDVLSTFPNSIEIREQLITIAKREKNPQDVMKWLKEIIRLSPRSEKYNEKMNRLNER